MRPTALLAATVLLALGSTVQAQTLPGPRRDVAEDRAAPSRILPIDQERFFGRTDSGALAVVGVLTGAASIVGGAFLGAAVEKRTTDCGYHCEFDGLSGAILGAWLLPPVAIPLSVHLTNEGHGSFPASFAASLGAGAATLLVGAMTDRSLGFFLLAPPIAEVITSVIVEQATTHPRLPPP